MAATTWQVPRCSAMLRHFQCEQDIDLEELAVARQQRLERRLAARQQRQESRGNAQWLAMFGELEGHAGNATRTREMRDCYAKFMKLVADVAAEGSRVEELHAIALYLYNQITSRTIHGEHLKKKAVEGMLGPIEKSAFREMKSLVDNLAANWVGALAASDSKAPKSKKKNGSAQKKPAAAEFGEAEAFVLPYVHCEQAQDLSSGDSPEASAYVGWEDAVAPAPAPAPALNSESEPLDYRWLVDQCGRVLGRSGTGGSIDEAMDLAQNMQSMLSSKTSDEELQNDLFELLGDFEFIAVLLANRQRIAYMQPLAPDQLAGPPAQADLTAAPPRQEVMRVGVSLYTEEEKKLMKQQRKAQRKQRNAGGKLDGELDFDSHADIVRARREAWQDQFASDSSDLSEVVAALPESTGAAGSSGWGSKMAMPKGTTRKHMDGYEEVFVPMARRDPPKGGWKLVPIDDLPDFARMVFRGTKSLNRLQSRVFETAFYSNENMLVCAPTGAGKTNVAMLTILHEISNHFVGGVLQRDQFKIIYVAPMKALATEITNKFNKALMALGVIVKELTGDTQLTKKQIQETQVIVTTPEKWDVITRKSGDGALTSQVRLLIIDEVHLLNEERGAVIETLVARTLRQVEASQSMIRIVGLSATLPNYVDAAEFLRVNQQTGLFYFDDSYRPVPLSQFFLGVKETNHVKKIQKMNDIAWIKAAASVQSGKQVLIFVHARTDTVRTAQTLMQKARDEGKDFSASEHAHWGVASKDIARSRNQEMKELFQQGFGIHHAGMLRQDRLMMERYYEKGLIKVLVCTATLAWGVNLPAYTVIIKGTQVYNPEKGGFIELSMLDVMQCFGRAGRPQYDSHGEGMIITTHDKLNHYLAMLNHGLPIESTYITALANHLNAEIVLGTVTNVDEAVTWLGYTYLSIRMRRNPLAYGISMEEKHADPMLVRWRRDLIERAAQRLRQSRMIRYDKITGHLNATNLGRVASHYYINVETVETFTDPQTGIQSNMSEAALFALMSSAKEFENVKVRPDEMSEMDKHLRECEVTPVRGGVENPEGKINVLMQAYLSHSYIDGFAMVSDQAYIINSAGRLTRALFEIVFRDKGWVTLAMQLLDLTKALDRRVWYYPYAHPLAQFGDVRGITRDILGKLEARGPAASLERMRDMTDDEIGALVFNKKMGPDVARCVRMLPHLEMSVSVQPITRTVLRVELTIRCEFDWSDRVHGMVEPWWIWVQDAEVEKIYYTEYFMLHKMKKDVDHKIFFTIPISDPPPPQYFVYAESDRWLGAGAVCEMNFRDLLLPQRHASHTDLLDLNPLPKTALRSPEFEALYPRFSHFNAIQTQIFHCMYHTDNNALIGAPTGSGKTNCGELAMMRTFKVYPSTKIVYIAPLKALVRERMIDWKERLVKQLGKSVVELTGDSQTDAAQLAKSDVICTTPEKWDGVTRSWAQRDYVKQVSCVIMDEIHLLGGDRGPILEVIVSRMRYIASQRNAKVRFVGLSTALANARDLADWLGIDEVGLFNFKPSVRPVPLEVHIAGYAGKHYCPRMATMNRPTYLAIMEHSRRQPALVFVSSRRQTRLTALDLISFSAAADHTPTFDHPQQFLHMPQEELDMVLSKVHDTNLKHTLAYGIGLHHAGLNQNDKTVCEELFAYNKIQVLVSTSTLAWGVNLPAHLVVVKGTEFFDAKTKRYVDYPITDVLQMMGRAGRPQFDVQGKAVILVQDIKKEFYKKFVYEPFPVESSLPDQLHNHFCAEVVSGTIASKQDAIDYLTWTYFFRRLVMNPAYYHLEDLSHDGINAFLSNLVDNTLADLEEAQCVLIDEMTGSLEPLTLGRIASYYYLDYSTVMMFANSIGDEMSIPEVLAILSDATEFEEVPVRHNEDKLNAELCEHVRMKDALEMANMELPSTKTQLLLQAHFDDVPLPISDYYTDIKMVLDQAIRVIQAMVDVSADSGWLATTLSCMGLVQMIVQAKWHDASTLTTLPNIDDDKLAIFARYRIECLPELVHFLRAPEDKSRRRVHELERQLSRKGLTKGEYSRAFNAALSLPLINVNWSMETDVFGPDAEGQVNVVLSRVNMQSMKVMSPVKKYNGKSEGHWLVLGCEEQGELLALKRVTVRKKTETTLNFYTEDLDIESGDVTLSLYLISDSYLGLDQQYDLPIFIDPELCDEGSDEDEDGDEDDEQFEDFDN